MAKVKLILEVKEKSNKEIYGAMSQDIFDKGRSKLEIKLQKDLLRFIVTADDYTSVRAAINAILLKLRMLEEIENKISQK